MTEAKVGQDRPKIKHDGGSLISTVLPNINVLGKSLGILKPENRKSRSRRFFFTYFAKVIVMSYLFSLVRSCQAV